MYFLKYVILQPSLRIQFIKSTVLGRTPYPGVDNLLEQLLEIPLSLLLQIAILGSSHLLRTITRRSALSILPLYLIKPDHKCNLFNFNCT